MGIFFCRRHCLGLKQAEHIQGFLSLLLVVRCEKQNSFTHWAVLIVPSCGVVESQINAYASMLQTSSLRLHMVFHDGLYRVKQNQTVSAATARTKTITYYNYPPITLL